MAKEITILQADTNTERTAILQRAFAVFGRAVNVVEFDSMTGLNDFIFGNNKSKQPGNKFYVLFLNLALGDDSITMLTKIKSDKQWQQMPIIILGPANQDDTVKTCHNLGCNVYLNDPETTDQYAEVMNAIAKFLYIVRMPIIKQH